MLLPQCAGRCLTSSQPPLGRQQQPLFQVQVPTASWPALGVPMKSASYQNCINQEQDLGKEDAS